MSPVEVLLTCVALGLVLLTGRGAIPGLLVLIRPSLMRSWFLDADHEARVLGASPLLEESLQRLKAQGFYLLGVKAEKLPLWGPEYREVAMAARDQTSYVSIVLHPFGAPASTYLYTPLSGGGMVFTRDYAGGPQAEGDGVSVRNVPTDDVVRLASDHRARVESVRARGAALDLRTSQAGRLEATRTFYASAYFRRAAMPHILPGLVGLAVSVVLFLWTLLAPLFK